MSMNQHQFKLQMSGMSEIKLILFENCYHLVGLIMKFDCIPLPSAASSDK